MRSLVALVLTLLLAVMARAAGVVEHTEGDPSGPFSAVVMTVPATTNGCPTEVPFAAFYRTDGTVGVTIAIYWIGTSERIGSGGNSSGCPDPHFFKTPISVLAFPLLGGGGPQSFKDDFLIGKFQQSMNHLDPKDGVAGKVFSVEAQIWTSGNAALGFSKVDRKEMFQMSYPSWTVLSCRSDACTLDFDKLGENGSDHPPAVILPAIDPSNGQDPDHHAIEVEPSGVVPNPIGIVDKIARYLFIPPATAFDALKEAVHKLATWGPLGWLAAWGADYGDATADAYDIHLGSQPFHIDFPSPYGTITLDLSPYQTPIKCLRYLLLGLFLVRVLPPFVRWLSRLI